MKSRILFSVLLALWIPSCGGTPPGLRTVPEGPASCLLTQAEEVMPRLIRIGLTEPVISSRAPVPANEAERLVFRHLYETLVTVDCRGDVHPGLARKWSVDETGREWTFELRGDARWGDGVPVTAEAVRESWQRNRIQSVGESPWIWVDPDSVRTMGDEVLLVTLSDSVGELPVLFAHPALAAARRESSMGWPQGSGPYLVSLDHDRTLSLIAHPYSDEPYRSPLDFLIHPRADARDLLAQGVDALLTGTRDALAYAGEIPGMTVSREGVARDYVLLSRRAEPAVGNQEPLARFRRDLARNVVTSDAEACSVRIDCGTDFGFVRIRPIWKGHPVSARVVYADGDADARVLAERLVAVALSSEPGPDSPGFPLPLPVPERPPVASSLSPYDLEQALRIGNDWAAITSVRRGPFGSCETAGELLLAAPWLLEAGMFVPDFAIPLVSVHVRLVSRTSLAGVRVDGEGVFLFDRAGWIEGEETP